MDVSGILRMRAKLMNLDAGYICFTVGLVLWLACRILLTTTIVDTGVGSLIGSLVKAGLLLCLFSEIFAWKFTFESFCLLLAFGFFSLVTYRVGGLDIVYLLCIAYTSRRYSLDSILIPALIVVVATCAAVVCLSLTEVIPSATSVVGSRVRSSLGFNWVTFLSHYYLEIVILYAVVRKGRLPIWQILLLFAVDFAIYEITDSRNSFLLAAIFLAILFFLRKRGSDEAPDWLRVLLSCSFLIGLLLSAFLYVLPDPSSALGVRLNGLLSRRLIYTQEAIAAYGISPLGTKVTWVTQSLVRTGQYDSSQYLYVDCSYFNIAINYGWLFLAFIITLLTVTTNRSIRTAGLTLGIGLAFFALHGVVDPQLLDLHYCVFLVLLGNAFDPDDVWTDKMKGLKSSVSKSEPYAQ